MTTPKRSSGMTRVLVLLTAAMTVATASCGDRSGDTVHKDSLQQQLDELLKRPDIDEAVSRYERMRTEIRERLTAETGIGPWQDDRDSSGSGCREFPDVDGMEKESRALSIWYAEANLPDEKWPRAVEIFQQITSSYGFESTPRTVVGQPGNHEVTASDSFGADVILGTKLSTTLALLTGCHPTETGRGRHTPPTQ